MRDKGKFSELIEILREDISAYQNAMTTGLAKKDRFPSLLRATNISYLEIAKAHFSNGADKSEVKNAVLNCIPAFEKGFIYDGGFGDYDDMICMISLAILCDVDLAEFNRITAILKRDKANDELLSFMIQFKDPSWPSGNDKALQEHPYAKAIGLNDVNEIKTYLEKVWYQGHSDAAWHDTHLNKAVNCYSGYWAWEVAALVKIKGIDDADLKDQKYYPYDAVHW